MTNDRFAAQLRQHLLATADERPADGQLDAILDRVADTPRRRSFVARLTWFPGRIGGIPLTVARYGLIAALVGATVGGAILVGGSNVPTTPDPSPSVAPSVAPSVITSSDPEQCADVPAGASYRGDLGSLALTVTIPADAKIPWQIRGGGFSLMSFCTNLLYDGGPFITAEIVTSVDGSCELGDAVAVDTAGDVVAALTTSRGFALSEPAAATLGGFPAARFEHGPDASMCFDDIILWNQAVVHRGTTLIDVVDVNGLPLGITITDINDLVALYGVDYRIDPAQAIAEAEAILASLTIDVVPGGQPSRAPVPTPDTGCVQYNDGGTYTAPVGPISVTATLPDDPAIYWSGFPNWFDLRPSPCGFDAPLTFTTQLITRVADGVWVVAADACRADAAGDTVEVHSAAEAATALENQASTDATDRTELIIDGRPAVRIRMTVPWSLDTTQCHEGAALLLGQGAEDSFSRIDQGATYFVHLIDVDGSILAFVARHEDGAAEDPAVRDAIDAIVGSLEIGPARG